LSDLSFIVLARKNNGKNGPKIAILSGVSLNIGDFEHNTGI